MAIVKNIHMKDSDPKFCLGDKQIGKMYLGDTLIYDISEIIQLYPNIDNQYNIDYDLFEELLD